MLDFKSDIKKFEMDISGKWTSYIAKPRRTFAIFEDQLSDISIKFLLSLLKSSIA